MKFKIETFGRLTLALSLGLNVAYSDPGMPGEWEKTRLYQHFGKGSSKDLTSEEYEFAKNNYGISVIEKNHAQNLYGGNPGHEIASRKTADNLFEDNQDAKPLMIYSIKTAYPKLFESTAEALENNPGYFYEADNFTGWEININKSAARNWWVNTLNYNVNNSDLQGIFVDGFTSATLEGNVEIAESMLKRLNGTIIYNGFDISGDARIHSGHESLKAADGVYVEDFFRGRCKSTANAVHLLNELIKVDNSKIIVCNSDPHGWSSSHKLSHRAHLLVANDNTYYRWDSDTDDELTYWTSDYGREIGAPLGPAVYDSSYKYKRIFEHCTISVNVLDKTHSASWGQDNKNNSSIGEIYEAESASRSRGSVKSTTSASNNKYVDGNSKFKLTFNNVESDGGEHVIAFRIKAPSGTRSMGVYVNGSKQGSVTATSKAWNAKSLPVILEYGSNTIELRDSEGTTELDVDYLTVPKTSQKTLGPLQAELAEMTSSSVKTDRVNTTISGEKFVDCQAGAKLKWRLRSKGLTRTLNFRVKSPSGTRAMGVYVNGSRVGQVKTSNNSWTTKSVTAYLSNGLNTLELRDSEEKQELDVDYVIVEDH